MGVFETLGRPPAEVNRLAIGIGHYLGARLSTDYWGHQQAISNARVSAEPKEVPQKIEETMIMLSLLSTRPMDSEKKETERDELQHELVEAIQEQDGKYSTDYEPYAHVAQEAIRQVAETDPEALGISSIHVPEPRRNI